MVNNMKLLKFLSKISQVICFTLLLLFISLVLVSYRISKEKVVNPFCNNKYENININLEYKEINEYSYKFSCSTLYDSSINILIFYWALKSKSFKKFTVIANCAFIALILKNLSFNMPIVGRMMMYFNWFQFILIPLSISEMRINSQAKLYCKAFILIMLFIGVFHNLLSPVMKMVPYVLE